MTQWRNNISTKSQLIPQHVKNGTLKSVIHLLLEIKVNPIKIVIMTDFDSTVL